MTPKPWEKKEGNVLRNKEPARGIFANIDLDSLNRKQVKEKEPKPIRTESGGVKAGHPDNTVTSEGNLSVANQTVRTVLGIRNEKKNESSDEEFGPKLPPAMAEKSIVISSDSDVGDDKWKEKKKKKDKKKHKERKKYKKKKESKRSKHCYSSDSSVERRKRKTSYEENYKQKKKRRYSSSSG